MSRVNYTLNMLFGTRGGLFSPACASQPWVTPHGRDSAFQLGVDGCVKFSR